MAYVPYLMNLIEDQYYWLVDYSDKTGDSMASVIRQALREFKEKHDSK